LIACQKKGKCQPGGGGEEEEEEEEERERERAIGD
jgi:hypothetical protein